MRPRRVETTEECIWSCLELRTGANPSISSKKMIDGWWRYACAHGPQPGKRQNGVARATLMRKWNGCWVVAVVAHLLEGDAQLSLRLAHPLGEAVSAVPHEERNTLLALIITATRA